MNSATRPEHIAPPELYYNQTEAGRYANNSHIIEVQCSMAERCVELLALPADTPCFLLDLGTGSGLSGEVLSEMGHTWVGLDISESMLGVAVQRGVDGDLIHSDLGQGLFFRPGSFDGAISVSALQWLCNADKKCHEPRKRLTAFFQSLYNCLVRGARAVFQFYPETPQQMELITSCAMRCGFSGGLVVDYPNSTRAKKYYLCLCAGSSSYQVPAARTGLEGDMEVDETIKVEPNTKRPRPSKASRKHRAAAKDKDWVLKKKERRRLQGKQTARDSKYTARKRKPKAI